MIATAPKQKFDASLTVFFPCHNEELNVERVTRGALEACNGLVDDFEILIVDDGSVDRTYEISQRLSSEHERVRVVRNETNLGYGGALQVGFREARKDFVFYTDGDGQFEFAQLGDALALIEEFDVVSGYRVDRKDSWIRRLNGRCWSGLMRVLFGLRLQDIDCAYKVYPKRFLEEVELRSKGALIDTEMLTKAHRLGLRIGQLGVHHFPRVAGESSGASPAVILKAFRELITLRGQILEDTSRADSDR